MPKISNKSSVPTGAELRSEVEIVQAQESPLKTIEGNEGMKMSWRRIYANVSILQFKEGGYGEDEIMEDKQFFLWSGGACCQAFFYRREW